jgi:hypothetical protein
LTRLALRHPVFCPLDVAPPTIVLGFVSVRRLAVDLFPGIRPAAGARRDLTQARAADIEKTIPEPWSAP